MSEEMIEELKEEIRAALQGLSEEEIFFLTEIGARVDSPSQAVRRVSPIVHLNPKEEEIVRKIARLKKMVRDVDPSANFPKVLQDLRKPKEFKMKEKEIIQKVEKLDKKIQALKAEIGIKDTNISKEDLTLEKRVDKLTEYVDSETTVAKFIKRVIESFESDIYLLKYVREEHSITFCQVGSSDKEELERAEGRLMDKKELARAEEGLKELGFTVDRPKRNDSFIDIEATLRGGSFKDKKWRQSHYR